MTETGCGSTSNLARADKCKAVRKDVKREFQKYAIGGAKGYFTKKLFKTHVWPDLKDDEKMNLGAKSAKAYWKKLGDKPKVYRKMVNELYGCNALLARDDKCKAVRKDVKGEFQKYAIGGAKGYFT